MDKNEQSALIERLEHASGDQAKRALRSMILKCTTRHSTIARAIRDAIDRHAPAPSIVYENPVANDNSDAFILPSAPVLGNKAKDKGHGRQGDEAVLSGTSDEDTGALRRHTKASKKTKTTTSGKGKRVGHQNPPQSNLDSSKKSTEYNKARHAPTHRAQTEHRAPQRPVGPVSQQAKTNVLDLVPSSDLEARGKDRLPGRILKNDVSDEDLAVAISSEDEPWYAAQPQKHTDNSRIPNDQSSKIGNSGSDSSSSDSSDDESSIDERQGNSLAVAAGPPREGPKVKTKHPGAPTGGSGPRAQSVTVPRAEATNQHGAGNLSSFGLSKKRKAPDLPVEKAHNQASKSATDIHLVKRPRPNQPQDQKDSLKNWRCRKCNLLFPSVAALLEHHTSHREDEAARDGHHRQNKLPGNDNSNQPQQTQKAGGMAGDNSTGKAYSTTQHSSRH